MEPVLVVRVGAVWCCLPAWDAPRVVQCEPDVTVALLSNGQTGVVRWLGRFWGLPRPPGRLLMVVGDGVEVVEEVGALARLSVAPLPAHLGPLPGVLGVARSPRGPLLLMKPETPHAP